METGTRTQSKKRQRVTSSLTVLKAFHFLDLQIVYFQPCSNIDGANKNVSAFFFLQGNKLFLF